MTDSTAAVNIRILGKEYRIACSENERDELLESAGYLDEKMREARDAARITGSERIAVMAALNITHELVQMRKLKGGVPGDINDELIRIQHRIDTVLDTQETD
ncbi:MAG: cell division protein ZapA [Methylococcales bacterium]|nr:cell division protein ZapA [Methylococcales bacterium]MEE2767341.1 cell division protein ZapA [Pseudomonadota bacterium]